MLVKLAWKNIWRNKLRTGIMLSAMTFGLLGVVTMMGFMSGMVDNMVHNAISWQTSHIQIHNHKQLSNPDLEDVINHPQKALNYLSRQDDIQAWSPRFIVQGMIGSARSNRSVRIIGVDPDNESLISPLANSITQGQWLPRAGRNPVLVSEKIANRLRLRIGSKVVLTFADASKDVTGAAFRVSGIFKTPSTSFDDQNIYVRIRDIQKIAGMTGFHEIALLYRSTDTEVTSELLTSKVTEIKTLMDDTTLVRDWREIQPLLASMISAMAVSNGIILGIFVLAMCLGIINIMLMSVYERTREFGVLMAVGMKKHQIIWLIICESTWLGLCGASLGLIVSETMIQILAITGLPLGSMAEGLGAYGVDTILYPRVSLFEYQIIFVTVVSASVIAAIYPARQVLKKSPAEAMAS